MKLSLIDRNDCLDSKTRSFAERRLRFALARFDNRIEFVSLVFSDANGPRGGIDKQCKIRVKVKRQSEIVINDKDSNLRTCIARVAERAGRTVSRVIDRTRDTVRRSRFAEPAFDPDHMGFYGSEAMLPAGA